MAAVSASSSQRASSATNNPTASTSSSYSNINKTVSFISPKDSVLDESTRMKLKYGNGKNLVAIGPPKKRGVPAWALPPPGFQPLDGAKAGGTVVEAGLGLGQGNAVLGLGFTSTKAKVSSVPRSSTIGIGGSSMTAYGVGPPEPASKPTANSMHSSPFTFGFGLK